MGISYCQHSLSGELVEAISVGVLLRSRLTRRPEGTNRICMSSAKFPKSIKGWTPVSSKGRPSVDIGA